MSYVALYRAYRPKDFSDVSGQEVIVQTLVNTVKTNKVGHAYLFSGPRGTGKTSIAKIFAKAINCENLNEGNPCNECASCLNANSNSASDIIEIDGASNNGVDEIRDLRDKVKYMPSISKYKVYIIDEVHMLTTGAFNALLKTLEEPPAHVVFILATTEVHKIPSTIISRCQRFDFKNIDLNNIVKRLKYIVGNEKIEISDEAINIVAHNAKGGLRDALSLLDQAVSFASGSITASHINDIVGTVGREDLVKLLELISDREVSEALKLVKEFLDSGKEEERLINDLIYLLRDLLLVKVSYVEDSLFTNLTKSLNVNKIYHYLNILIEMQSNMKYSSQKRIYVEIALIQMMEHEDVLKIDLSNQVDSLRKEIQNIKTRPAATKAVEEKKALVEINHILETLYTANQDSKDSATRVIENIENSDPNLDIIIKHIKECEVVAASNEQILLTNDNLLIARELMQPANQELVKKLINKQYYVILTNDWLRVRGQYVDLLSSGQKRPVINFYDFKIYEINKDEVKEESAAFKLAKEMFGTKIVEFKE